MTNEKRIQIEEGIVQRYLKAVRDAGWTTYKMDTGGGREPWREDGLFEADECFVLLRNDRGTLAMLYFVYGNEPGEVLNDYSTRLEDAIAPVNTYAEQWA